MPTQIAAFVLKVFLPSTERSSNVEVFAVVIYVRSISQVRAGNSVAQVLAPNLHKHRFPHATAAL